MNLLKSSIDDPSSDKLFLLNKVKLLNRSVKLNRSIKQLSQFKRKTKLIKLASQPRFLSKKSKNRQNKHQKRLKKKEK